MAQSSIIQIRGKGTVTIPIEMRRKYDLDEGDILTLIDLGEGSFLLTPVVTRVNQFGDRISRAMAEEEISLDEILTMLDEERESFYQDRYAGD